MSLSTTSTDLSPSSIFSSVSTTPSLTTQTTVAQITTPPPSSTVFGGGNGGGGNNGPPNNNSGSGLATSAALYLYTFLATLVLLLSVSAAIVIRSFILRRRHRRMVEEAIRNGTWVPPAPPSRPVRVDLSKKPVLWEAYIDNKGSISYSHGGGQSLNPEWMTDQAKDWDMIRPISAAYLASSTALGPTTSVPTAADPTPPNPIPGPTPVDELPSHSDASSTRTPRHRAIFSRAMRMLNPTPVQTSPLPAANLSNANINAGGSGAGDAHILMTELDGNTPSPSLIRVAVLIAMPSPPSSSSSTAAPSTAASPSASVSVLTSPPPSINPTTSPAKLSTISTQSHPLQINPAFPLPLPPAQDDEPLLPHIEVGVADILVVPPDLVTQDERIHERKFRGSVVSQDSVASEVG